MLWYSFIFKHLHALKYSLWAWLVSPNTNAHHTYSRFSYLFISFFFRSEKSKKEREWERVCDSGTGVRKQSRERAWIATKFVFAHFVVATPRQTRDGWHCPYVIIMFTSFHSHTLSASKCLFALYGKVYSICSTCLCVCLCECIEYFFLLSFWYSLVSLEQIKQFFLRSLVIYCVHGSWPRCIFWNSTYGDPNAKRRKNRVGLFKRMEIHRKGKEFYPMCVVCTVYVYHIISLKELLSHCCIQNWHILLFLSVSLSLPTFSTLQAPSLLSMLPSAHPPSSFQFLSCKRRVFFHLLIRQHIHD